MSDEVSQFLEQVERLRGQQIEEDEVRTRELEEYMAAKRERQARREERARSISPQKSPANTPSPRSSTRRSVHLSDAPKLESPAVAGPHDAREGSADDADADDDAGAMAYAGSSSPTKENEAPSALAESKQASASTQPARSSTLSWQRRPNSRGGGSRPLSMVAAQNATQRSLGGSQEPSSATEQAFSKDQIAQSLGSKDPAWFRQTADRGQNSAAYRRSQVEDQERFDMASVRAQLPGMSADGPSESTPSEDPASRSSNAIPAQAGLGSPLQLNRPQFDAPAASKPPNDQPPPSPTGRASPTRSPSPTKGMGGFVQSAMMKRSDSVKRWSVTSPPGLTRADSVTSGRTSTYDRALPSRPQSTARGSSTTPTNSRPTSGHGEKEAEPEAAPSAPAPEPTKPATKRDEDEPSLPSSPTKTMDQRRWSPTKASWLESALNKPESPKPQPKPASSQPAWMVELNKNKAERANNPNSESGQTGSTSHKHQVSIGGLMRATPMGAAVKPNTTGLGGIYSPPPGGNRPAFGHGAKPSLTKATSHPEPRQSEEKPAETQDLPEDEETQEAKTDKRASVTSPEPDKRRSRPETPPKKDFRASLQQRPADSGPGKTNEPEFKNVFGNLRRTQTQNYVAPDELKGNILRGKAALNVTGGPQKTERKDEFKEAILKKKDDFKKAQSEGKGITRNPTSANEQAVPEGLAKRAVLGRSMTGSNRDSISESKPPAEPKKTESPKPSPGPKRISSQSGSTSNSPAAMSPPSRGSSSDELRRVRTDSDAKPNAEPRGAPSLQKETSAPSNLQQGRAGGGKLAGRFNPGLADMLARGPPPMATNRGQSSDESRTKPGAGDSTELPAPAPQLTHMTKGRVRGPRRKAPTTAATAPAASGASSPATDSIPKTEPKNSEASSREAAIGSGKEAEYPQEGPSSSTSTDIMHSRSEDNPAPLSIHQQVAARAGLRGKTPPAKPQPKAPDNTTAPEQASPSVRRRQPSSPEKPTVDTPAPLRPHKTGDAASQPGSPKKLDTKRMSRFMDEAPTGATKPEPVKEPGRLSHQRTGSRSPVKQSEDPPSSPTKVDSDPVASVKNATSMFGGASAKSPPPDRPKSSFDRLSPRPEGSPKPEGSPRTQAKGPRPLPIAPLDGAKSPPQVDSPARSPTKQASELSGVLNDFFGPQRPNGSYQVDAAEILANRPRTDAKIKSSGVQMFQVSGDGKKVPVPAHHERVLFDREMYLCAHEFANEANKKTVEVYLWVGDEVPASAAEDAQLFAQREARALGGRLVRLPQGKETSEFVQALGGVVITRRGSSNKYDSLAPAMLCGRRYLGQVAFDEVDFAPASLCAGFPYLIALSGKCYLWKGKGSDVDEVGCARLIGMDLALMGELVECEDGAEPAAFWDDVFGPGAKKPHSADHWRLKPSYSKYCSRLFCSDADTRSQIFEISPFSQADLSPSRIYVLDAFFEMYVVVGARAQPQYASFRNALDFAHEYAILAASVEDRPFVPVSSVVLEGVPRDLKSVFRRWDDARGPTLTKQALTRGRSLRVVPLTQALLALKE